jgi:hypothetical protein
MIKNFLISLAFFTVLPALADRAPTVQCSVIDESVVSGSAVTDFGPFVFVPGHHGDSDSYEATATIKGVNFKLLYDLGAARIATFVSNGRADALTSSFPFLPKGQRSRVLFYVPFDAQGGVLRNPMQFDVECFE